MLRNQQRTGEASNVYSIPALLLVLFGAVLLVELTMILWLNQGHFMYSLDDPYIHLALAENIARGHYGINASEYAAPSSSIAWPFLLAPFSRAASDYYLPLLIGVLSAGATLLLSYHFLEQVVLEPVAPARRRQAAATLTVALALATNVVGLIFTGMEHTPQLFLSLVVVVGLVAEHTHGRLHWWLLAAIVGGPLLRYENLALTLPALLYLLWRRHYLAAGGCLLVLATLIGGFSLFLNSLGLGFLPSSILMKSAPAASGASASSLIVNLVTNTASAAGAFLLVGLLLLLLPLRIGQRPSAERALAAWAAGALGLHFAVGRFGWFGRYEMYILATTLLMLLYLYRKAAAHFVEQTSQPQLVFALALFLMVVCTHSLVPTILTPLAAQNIYEQHYQMHRFLTEYYPRPVAANDIGWVAYRNDGYVLDIAGLGSREALLRRRQNADLEWINAMSAPRGVSFAMVYASDLGQPPANWQLIGELWLSGGNYSAANQVVTFFAFDSATARELYSRLEAFQQDVPAGVSLRLTRPNPPPATP